MAVRDISDTFTPWIDYPNVPYSRLTDPADPESPKISGTKTYRVQSPDSHEGVRLTALANLGIALGSGVELSESDRASLQLDDAQQKDLYKRLLGDTHDEMLADGVPWLVLKAIAEDALIYFGMSPEAADLTVQLRRGQAALADGSGEALARANRADRRKATKRTARKTAGSKSGRASTATRARTRSPASTPSSTSPSEPEVAPEMATG